MAVVLVCGALANKLHNGGAAWTRLSDKGKLLVLAAVRERRANREEGQRLNLKSTEASAELSGSAHAVRAVSDALVADIRGRVQRGR